MNAKKSPVPQLKAMLSALQAPTGAADFVLVHKLDRLARNRRDDVAISLAIREAGATLVSCSANIDETPSGSLMHSIIAGMAE